MRRVTTWALAGALALGTLSVARAQSRAGAPEDVLPSLLGEVRGLRAAIEHMASGGARVQLALGRLQLQEQRVNAIVKRLDETRTVLAAAQARSADMQDQAEQSEKILREMSGPNKQPGQPDVEKDVLAQIEGLRRDSARQNVEVQRLLGEEAMVANELSAAQSEWTRLNQRLDEVERSLDPPVVR
jgi:hypothetical protein